MLTHIATKSSKSEALSVTTPVFAIASAQDISSASFKTLASSSVQQVAISTEWNTTLISALANHGLTSTVPDGHQTIASCVTFK
jgi:hypothetical protein